MVSTWTPLSKMSGFVTDSCGQSWPMYGSFISSQAPPSFFISSSGGVLPSSFAMKLNDVKPKEGGTLGWFMATRGFHLSRHNWLLLTAGRKMNFCLEKNCIFTPKAIVILCGRRITSQLGKNVQCQPPNPQKTFISGRKHSRGHISFVCLYLSHCITPSRSLCFSPAQLQKEYLKPSKCSFLTATICNQPSASRKTFALRNKDMRMMADFSMKGWLTEEGNHYLSEWRLWNWVREAEKMFTDVYSSCGEARDRPRD